MLCLDEGLNTRAAALSVDVEAEAQAEPEAELETGNMTGIRWVRRPRS